MNASRDTIPRRMGSILVVLAVSMLFTLSPFIIFSSNSQSSSVPDAQPASEIIARTSSSVTCSPSGLCPAMLDTAYGFDTLHSTVNGIGQAVVIVDACGNPKISSDLIKFDTQFGLSNPTLNIFDPQGTPTCTNIDSPKGWSLEISLDVEWAHVVAPGATINLVVAALPSTADLIGAWSYALTNKLGNQISNSWSGAGGCSSSISSVLKTATKDHVTVLASAGDTFAWGNGTTQIQQSPADCMQALTVGGTSLSATTTGSYISEQV